MEEREDKLKVELEKMLKRAKNQNGASQILAMLFPKVENVLKTYAPDSMNAQERVRARRVSVENFAESYFGLDPRALVWSRADIDEIVKSDQPAALFAEAQQRIERAPKVEQARLRTILLDSLNGAFEESYPFTLGWLIGFVDASPYFLKNKDESPEFFGSDNLQRMRWIVLGAIRTHSC